MSLFSFIKTAGATIFGGKSEREKAAELRAELLKAEKAAALSLKKRYETFN